MNPEIKSSSGLYSLWWGDYGIQMEVSHVYSHKDGRTQAEILVLHRNGDGNSRYLNRTQMNLLASPTRKKFAKEMDERLGGPPWEDMIERMAFEVLALDRAGEPAVEITTSDEVNPPSRLVWPLMPERQPTIIYGPGSAGKSLFCEVVAVEAMLPGSLLKLGLKADKCSKLLYLDWEADRDEITWRMKCLQLGMNLPEIIFQYRRCALPLADDLEQVQRLILDKGIGLVVCDSLGPACGGDLNQAEPAIRFYGALRQLGVSSLITAHEAKDEISAGKGPYGNVYFFNLARSIWRMKKSQQPGDNNYKILLKHAKVNSGRLEMPLGFELFFGKDSISLRRIDAAKVPDLADIITVRLRIVAALKTKAYSALDLAAIVGSSETNVSKELTRMKQEGLVDNAQRGLWALVDHNIKE